MKAIVVYKSKTGYTKTYAEWIKEELQCDMAEAGAVTLEQLQSYDTIIYGGGLYAIGINGIRLIRDNFTALKQKHLIVWATGSNPGRPEEIQKMWEHNFSKEQLTHIKTYYLRGGFDYKKLSRGNKILMSMLKIKLKHTKDKTEDEMGLLKAYEVPEYHCNKKNIAPMIQYIRDLEKEDIHERDHI